MVKLALALPPYPTEMWRLGAQLGVTQAITGLPRTRPDGLPGYDFMSLLHMKQRFADAGYEVAGIEGTPLPMEKTKLGLPGRDEEIDAIGRMIENLGAVGIGLWCYNWMAVFGWLRTSATIPTRGGALVSGYDHALMANAPLAETGVVPDGQLWDSLAYFLDRVVPLAERARVKLAIHPDDPPISPIRGVARILRDADALRRVIELAPSDYNGITFCQGCFAEMGADIPEAIRYFGRRGKLHFAHFRTVRGTAERFVETFHDDGETNMFEAMRAYVEVGFDGPMRPDHVPTMEGDPNDHPGYTNRGRLYAIGYMRGLLEAALATR